MQVLVLVQSSGVGEEGRQTELWEGLEDPLCWQVGAALCRSRFHLWVLIWVGLTHSSCVCVCFFVCECVCVMTMVRGERNHLDSACSVYHNGS